MKKSPFFRPSHPRRLQLVPPAGGGGGGGVAAPSAALVQFQDAAAVGVSCGAVATACRSTTISSLSTKASEENKSTVLGTTANLVNAIVGCGIVGIPYAMAQCGIAAGLPLVLLVAFLTEKSLRLLIETAAHVHAGSYEVLAESCFGVWGFRFVALNMFITSYGAMVSYLMIVKDCFSGLLLTSHTTTEYDTRTMRRSILVIISLASVVPLACRRDMADLAVTSRLNVLIDTTLVAIVAFSAVMHNNHASSSSITTATTAITEMQANGDESESLVEILQGLQPLVHWNTIFVGLGVLSFAFVCQHAAFIIAGSLKEPARWSTVTSFALSGCAILALTCGIFGFWGYRNDTKGNILDNLDPNAVSTYFAKFLLGMTMLFVYPLESFVARHVCVILLFEGRAAHEGNDAYILNRRDRRVLLTLAVYIAAVLPAAMFEDLGPVLALTGAIGGSCLSYIGPGAVFLGVHGERFQTLVRNAWLGDTSCAAVKLSNSATMEEPNENSKNSCSVSPSISFHDELSPLIPKQVWATTNGNNGNNNNRINDFQIQLSPWKRFLWTVMGMPLWFKVADIGVKCVQQYAHDLAIKSPYHIRIGGVDYYNQQPAMLEHVIGPVLLAHSGGQDLHSLTGPSSRLGKIKTSRKQRRSSNIPAPRLVGWSDFVIAIGYILFGFVAMFAGIASLFIEENGR